MLQKKLNEIAKNYKEFNNSKPTATQKFKYYQAQGELLAEVGAIISTNGEIVMEKVEKEPVKKTTTKKTTKKTPAKKAVEVKEAPKKAPAKKSSTKKASTTKKTSTKKKVEEKIPADPNVNPMAPAAEAPTIKTITAVEAVKEDLIKAGLSADSLGYNALVEAVKLPKTVKYNEALRIIANNLGSLPHVLSNAIGSAVRKCSFIRTEYLQELARIKPDALTKEAVVYFLQNFGELAKDGIEIE